MSRVRQLAAVQREARRLFAKKNADYGDAFATYGSVGVLVRMGDKIGRLVSVDSHKVHVVEDETLRDTLIDLHNYSAMAIMLLDEKGGGDEHNDTPTETEDVASPTEPLALPPSNSACGRTSLTAGDTPLSEAISRHIDEKFEKKQKADDDMAFKSAMGAIVGFGIGSLIVKIALL